MTNKDKIRYVFRRFPHSRFNRANAYWYLLITFYGKEWGEFAKSTIYPSLMKFFRDFAGLERALRDVLREPEFRLPQELDAKRLEKASKFKQKYGKKGN